MKKNLFILLLLAKHLSSAAQKTDLIIVSKKAEYKNEVTTNVNNTLIDIKKYIHSIQLDLKYQTKDNFTKTNLYKKATTTYLRNTAAVALKKVADSLFKLNLKLKIWDAYRPYAATQLMWNLIKDERYVANPKTGSNHNRGLAIDLTLVDTQNIALDMGTGFDNFTDTAHHSFTQLSPEILANRKLLKQTMEHFGFKSFDTEWWHYTFITTEKFSVLNLDFKTLKKIIQ